MNAVLIAVAMISNVAVTVVTVAAASEETTSSNSNSNSNSNQCRLYLGPSTTSTDDEPKLGLYAGIDYDEDELIGRPEVGIPLVDFTEAWNRRDALSNNIMEFLEGFLWTAEYGGSKWEGNHSNTLAVPGYGVLANFHSGTHNVDWVQGSALLRETQADITTAGKAHPSRGAISTYHNFTMTATQPIKRGMELFANFGDVWDGNQTEDVFGDKLTRWDYQDADKILEKILDFMEKYDSTMTPQTKDDVLDFILGKILGTAAGNHAKVVRSLIPAHPGKLQTVKDMGGTFAYRNPDLVKTQKWLDKHAVCVDNLESQVSTIPEAGRGAFATRAMKKGAIVAPVPLLHIASEDVTFMYDLHVVTGPNGRQEYGYNMDKPRGQQLLINYCLAHPESSMLFFPIASMVTQVNHAPPEKANARLTWSKNKYWGNAFDLQDMDPDEMASYHHVSVTMELFAVRDIEEGEEILIDYGRDWEAAWKEHMETFNKAATDEWPLKADDLKLEYKNKPFKTQDQVTKDPYPEGVEMACFVETEEMEDGRPKVNANNQEIAVWTGPRTFKDYVGSEMYLCQILETKKTGDDFLFNYTILGTHNDVTTQVVNVPHRAITFIDMPYTSDMHHPDAFRHPIGIPDVIFPQAWRDRRD